MIKKRSAFFILKQQFLLLIIQSSYDLKEGRRAANLCMF